MRGRVTPKGRRTRRPTGAYTEKDIARLEAGDLTDANVCAELLRAYYDTDNDTDERPLLGHRQNVFRPDAEFKKMLADLEAIENPSAKTRSERLAILTQLAVRAKKREGCEAMRDEA